MNLRLLFRAVNGLIGLVMLFLSTPGGAQTNADPIAQGFADVPASARLRMFWRVFGPAWTRIDVDNQLRQLKQAGVGGVMTCFTYPVSVNNPAIGIVNQPFLSPPFLDTLRHAAETAKAKDIAFGVGGGTGWPFGGPTVSLADSAQRLRVETLAPYSDETAYAMPDLHEGETVLAVFCGRQDVTSHIQGNRVVVKTSQATGGQAYIAGPTYMKVKRPALGGEGYVIDHYNRAAIMRYLNANVAPLLNSVPKGTIQTLFCDSLEVYNANWTRDLPAEFLRRRGYALLPRLPDLFNDHALSARALRFDFWRTLAELAEERFAHTVQDWCHNRGLKFALEAYGTPPMGFTAARFCDTPWGEQYEWKGFSFSRFAASGAHLAGKNIVGAEAWTWAGIPNRLADSLSDLKLCSDLHFLSGENELTGVDFPYSPGNVDAPGWLPYYGPVMNQNNPQWFLFHYLTDYVSRCQWLLRQGKPVADVAVYVPTEDAFAEDGVGQMALNFHLRDRLATGELTDEFGLKNAYKHHSNTIQTLLANGFNFDGIDFFAMNAQAKIEKGQFVAGDGRYSILVLPNLRGIEASALEKIARFCREGGTVIALKGLPKTAYEDNRKTAQARRNMLLSAMFPPKAANANAGIACKHYGKGCAFWVGDDSEAFARALKQWKPGSDVRFSVANQDATLAHVHRRVGDRNFYFVANVGDNTARFDADFRAMGSRATLWNPMDGSITPLACRRLSSGYARVGLQLPSRGSCFVCLEPPGSANKPNRTPLPAALPPPPPSAMDFAATQNIAVWNRQPLRLQWRVSFEGPLAPPALETRDLVSWTQWPGAKFYSGRVLYTAVLDVAAPVPRRARLHFAQVREAAEVRVNGKRVGAVWTPPYEIDIGPYLEPGPNVLRVSVANLPVNRVLGLPDPDLQVLRLLYGDRFPAPQEKRLLSEPLPSGIIGDIDLLTSP